MKFTAAAVLGALSSLFYFQSVIISNSTSIFSRFSNIPSPEAFPADCVVVVLLLFCCCCCCCLSILPYSQLSPPHSLELPSAPRSLLNTTKQALPPSLSNDRYPTFVPLALANPRPLCSFLQGRSRERSQEEPSWVYSHHVWRSVALSAGGAGQCRQPLSSGVLYHYVQRFRMVSPSCLLSILYMLLPFSALLGV